MSTIETLGSGSVDSSPLPSRILRLVHTPSAKLPNHAAAIVVDEESESGVAYTTEDLVHAVKEGVTTALWRMVSPAVQGMHMWGGLVGGWSENQSDTMSIGPTRSTSSTSSTTSSSDSGLVQVRLTPRLVHPPPTPRSPISTKQSGLVDSLPPPILALWTSVIPDRGQETGCHAYLASRG